MSAFHPAPSVACARLARRSGWLALTGRLAATPRATIALLMPIVGIGAGALLDCAISPDRSVGSGDRRATESLRILARRPNRRRALDRCRRCRKCWRHRDPALGHGSLRSNGARRLHAAVGARWADKDAFRADRRIDAKRRRCLTHHRPWRLLFLSAPARTSSVVSLEVLFRWKVSNPLLIAATAVVGLIAYPWLQPAWVMVK
jgi:hypothetical protein